MTYQKRSMTIANGRLVTVHSVGNDGTPVVMLCHGMPGSGVMLEEAGPVADELGVSMVCVNRPGYGGSDRAAPGFEVAVDDALGVADRMSLERFATLGISGGGAYAAAVAAAAPERATAVGIAAGVGCWREIEPDRQSWDPTDVEILDLAEAGDLIGAASLVREGCDGYFSGLLTEDDEVIAAALLPPAESAEFADRFVRELRDALRSYDGLAYDNLTLGLSWNFDLSTIRQPAFLWYGDADTVVRVEHGLWYAERLNDARLCWCEGESHGSVIHNHWREMLRALTEVGRSRAV